MPASMGRSSAGAGRRHPVTIRKASLMVGSVRRVWALRHHAGAQYSAVGWTMAGVAVRSFVTPAPQPEPARRLRSATRDVSFLRSDWRCRRYVSDLSNVASGVFKGRRARHLPLASPFLGPPLKCDERKFSLFLMKNLLFTHIMYYKADHKWVLCFQRAPYRNCNVQVGKMWDLWPGWAQWP